MVWGPSGALDRGEWETMYVDCFKEKIVWDNFQYNGSRSSMAKVEGVSMGKGVQQSNMCEHRERVRRHTICVEWLVEHAA